MQRTAKDNNADVLVQLKQDWNTGYHMFNQRLARYYARKQQFTNVYVGQGLYQTPIDSIRVEGMTFLVTSTYEIPLKEIRSEYEWRQIVSVKGFKTNWPSWYFVLGKDQVAIWPLPSQNTVNGIRFYYQPQDHDLSIDDTTSTTASATVTVVNGQNTITADNSVTPFTTDMADLGFQVTGQVDLSFYDILSATTNTITLKSAYTGVSGSGKPWRIGQLPIIPQEYQQAPLHWAMWNYFESNSNENRAQWHKSQYDNLVMQCQEDYSSSTESSVISDDTDVAQNLWLATPPSSTV